MYSKIEPWTKCALAMKESITLNNLSIKAGIILTLFQTILCIKMEA